MYSYSPRDQPVKTLQLFKKKNGGQCFLCNTISTVTSSEKQNTCSFLKENVHIFIFFKDSIAVKHGGICHFLHIRAWLGGLREKKTTRKISLPSQQENQSNVIFKKTTILIYLIYSQRPEKGRTRSDLQENIDNIPTVLYKIENRQTKNNNRCANSASLASTKLIQAFLTAIRIE